VALVPQTSSIVLGEVTLTKRIERITPKNRVHKLNQETLMLTDHLVRAIMGAELTVCVRMDGKVIGRGRDMGKCSRQSICIYVPGWNDSCCVRLE
jgi:hypothetical protein